MACNYRVVKHVQLHPFYTSNPSMFPPTMERLCIHEFYYDADGKESSRSECDLRVESSDIENIRAMLMAMLKACDEPVIEDNERC